MKQSFAILAFASAIIGSWLTVPVLGAYNSKLRGDRSLQQTVPLQDLANNQALWESHNINNYGYDIRVGGPNPMNIVYPLSVAIQDKNKGAMKDGNGNPTSNWQPPKPQPQTIEDLFQTIKTALTQNPDNVRVTYNTAKGYPEDISIFYNAQSGKAPYQATTTNFQIETLRERALQSTSETSKLQELAQMQALWNSNVASKSLYNYRYLLKNTGSNPYNVMYPLNVTVRNQKQATATDGNGNPTTNWKAPKPQPETMDELFQTIRSAFNKNVQQLEVTYDAALGYPKDIYVVYNDQTADDTYDAIIYDFQIE